MAKLQNIQSIQMEHPFYPGGSHYIGGDAQLNIITSSRIDRKKLGILDD